MALAVVVGSLVLCAGARGNGNLTCATGIVNPDTGHTMIVAGYSYGVLEFRDWQGNVLASRSGFGEVTALEIGRTNSSPYPRLYVGSTDSGGALRVIDPRDIHTDLLFRSGFERVSSIGPGSDRVYVGSTDMTGSVRKLNVTTLADQVTRHGFLNVTTLDYAEAYSAGHLVVGSTDSGGALRYLDGDTLANSAPWRSGFGTIYDVAVNDVNENGISELVIASSDGSGTVRYVMANNLSTDTALRSGFGTVYAVAYETLGIAQTEGNNKASIAVASNDMASGVIRVMEVDIPTITTTLADTAGRSGFYTVGGLFINDLYLSDCDLLAAICTDGGTLALHVMDESLTDLNTFHAPEPTTFILVAGGLAALILRKRIRV